MHLDHYEIKTGTSNFSFYFFSEGPKGKIRKVVQFSPLVQGSVYNLSLCDYNVAKNDVDDSIVTDNGDTEKVLATVARIVYEFCRLYPFAWVYATGNTPSRTRLYRMGINKYFVEAEADFEIYGETFDSWERYQRGIDYKAFLVRLK